MFLTANKREKARTFDEIIALLDGGGSKTGSGVYVNNEKALQQSTVWACVRIISEIIAQLPIEVHVKEGASWKNAEYHDLLALIAEPNDWMTQHDLISFMIAWAEMHGNSYFYKVKNGQGVTKRLLPIEGHNCEPEMVNNWEITYTLSSDQGISGVYKKDRVFHFRNFGSNGYMGLSTIGNHKEGIGLAIALENHAVNAYKNGLQSNKWVQIEGAGGLTPEAKEKFRQELAKFQGHQNAGSIPAFSNAKIHELSRMSATDAQYIESRKMQKQEIASIFGVPLFLLNDTEKSTTWGTGLEQISRSFIRFSLNPRLNRTAQTFVKEFIPERDRQKTRVVFDTDQFTLGEFKERMEGYRSAIESGVLNANECREVEGRQPREGGDSYRIPMNTAIEGEQNEDQASDQTA